MTNITHEVWGAIERDPSLKTDISRGLINVRALARYMKKELRGEGSIDAIISAIRRYAPEAGPSAELDHAAKIVHQSKLSAKTNVVNIALVKDRETQDALPHLFSMIDYGRGEILRLVQGDESIKVMIDEKNLKKALEIFPDKKIIKVHKNLAEMNLHLHPKAVETPGIVLVITTEFARNNVNIVEVMSCVPELLIFVEEKDATKAYEILFKLCH